MFSDCSYETNVTNVNISACSYQFSSLNCLQVSSHIHYSLLPVDQKVMHLYVVSGAVIYKNGQANVEMQETIVAATSKLNHFLSHSVICTFACTGVEPLIYIYIYLGIV